MIAACLAAVVISTLGLVTLAPTMAGAESPLDLAEDLAVDGVYLAPGRTEIDEAAIADLIREARARGLRMVVVAPNDPQPTAEAFARRVLEASDADAALVFPTEGGLEANVIDEFESASLRALAAGRAKASPEAAVEAYTEELLVEPVRTLPPIIGQLVRGVLFLALILAAAVGFEQLLRRIFPKRKVEIVAPAENSTN